MAHPEDFLGYFHQLTNSEILLPLFCSLLLGLLIKCAYYQFGHPWMSLSQKLVKTSVYLFAIYGILGLAIIVTLFYFGIEENMTSLIVTATLLCSLVLLTFAGVVKRNISNEACQLDIEMEEKA